MNKELTNLLDNYENVIYGKAFPINPSIHQLHLLLDYIANLEQQCKKQKEVIDKAINAIDLVIELIKQQPTKDDRWILDRLNGFKIILEDKEVSE